MYSLCSLLLYIAALYSPYIHAEIKGSETTVSVISNSPVFPARDTNNTMLGFGYFQGGFTLQDATTSCTFDSVFPVSGFINMNGGTLYLRKDLVLEAPVTIIGLGKIVGNNHTITFCDSITSLPTNFSSMHNVNLVFKNNVALNGQIKVRGNCTIQGTGSTITFNNKASFIVCHNATLELQETVLANVGNNKSNTSISCVDDTGILRLNSTTVSLSADWTFAHGSIHFKNESAIAGSYNIYYTSTVPFILEPFSTLLNNQESELIFGPK